VTTSDTKTDAAPGTVNDLLSSARLGEVIVDRERIRRRIDELADEGGALGPTFARRRA